MIPKDVHNAFVILFRGVAGLCQVSRFDSVHSRQILNQQWDQQNGADPSIPAVPAKMMDEEKDKKDEKSTMQTTEKKK